MFFRLIVAIVAISVAFAGAATKTTAVADTNFFQSLGDTFTDLTKSHSLSASVDGVESTGLDGLNLKLSAPFEFMDYVVGVKAKINSLQSLTPDSLFVRKSFDDIDCAVDYDISSRKFSTNTKWFNDRVGIEVDADSEDLITQVQGHIKQTFTQNDRDINAKLSSVYDALTQKVTATFGLASGDVAAQVDFDNDTKESVIGVAYKVKEFTAHPSINVKSGEVKYGISRALSSGDIDAVLTPNDNVEVEWTDKAKNGAWKTKLNYPLNGGATKISFARDFDC